MTCADVSDRDQRSRDSSHGENEHTLNAELKSDLQ
jgi:hypothetical protein